jgi:hypothetical protein
MIAYMVMVQWGKRSETHRKLLHQSRDPRSSCPFHLGQSEGHRIVEHQLLQAVNIRTRKRKRKHFNREAINIRIDSPQEWPRRASDSLQVLKRGRLQPNKDPCDFEF